MRHILLFLFLSLSGYSKIPQLPQTNLTGDEFYVTIPPAFIENQSPGDNMRFFLYSEVDNVVNISNALGLSKTILLNKFETKEIIFTPAEVQATIVGFHNLGEQILDGKVYEGAALKFSGEHPFVLEGVTRYQATSDGNFFLPKNKLGNSYIASSYTSFGHGGKVLPGWMAIVGTEDNTFVRLTVGGSEDVEVVINGNLYKFGDEAMINIDEYDVLLISTSDAHQTIAGTRVDATSPVAVMSSNYCANIPVDNRWCDYTISQDLPIDNWGKTYIIPKIKPRVNSGIIRIYSAEDNTTIYKDGQEIGTIVESNGKENESWFEMRINPIGVEPDYAIIHSDKPISISFYNPGINEDQLVGGTSRSDPFQVNLVSIENLPNESIVVTPGINGGNPFDQNNLLLGVESELKDEISDETYFGEVISPDSVNWSVVKERYISERVLEHNNGSSIKYYHIFDIELPNEGTYVLKSDSKVFSLAYGNASYDSYGFSYSAGAGSGYDYYVESMKEEEEEIRDSVLIVDVRGVYISDSNQNLGDYSIADELGLNTMIGHNGKGLLVYEAEFKVEDPLTSEEFLVEILNENEETVYEFNFSYSPPTIILSNDGKEVGNQGELLIENPSMNNALNLEILDFDEKLEILSILPGNDIDLIESFQEVGTNRFLINLNRDYESFDEDFEIKLTGGFTLNFKISATTLLLEQGKDFTISPNPAKDDVNIQFEEQFTGTYKLVTMTGEVVYIDEINSNSLTLDLSELSTGTYLLELENKDGRGSYKIIKE